MGARWRIELLGGLRVRPANEVAVPGGDATVSRFRTRKTGLLLAYLAYYSDRAHPRDALVDFLWPDDPPEAGRRSLRQALTSLRRQLALPGADTDGLLVADYHTVRFSPGTILTDVGEFEAAIAASSASEASMPRIERLSDAVALYRGELLPGYYHEWVFSEREQLAECCFRAVRALIHDLEAMGDFGRALQYARLGVRLDPLREEAHQELIRLLAAAGDTAAAKRQYQELERLLEQELGAAPERDTRALLRPPVSNDGAADLPLSGTRFFGREVELARLFTLLLGEENAPPTRLVTLTGSGGSGKTRLALEAARRLAADQARAVRFVSLADLTEARRIPDAIREALRLPQASDVAPLHQVVAALSRRPTLLLLDNLEHLVDEGAGLVLDLLARVPTLTCLATSRRRLDVEGEREFPIGPLPASPAVQLFVDRAQAARSEFRMTAANAAAVATLCERLEGMPLAIELAAARATVLTPAQMLTQMERRFDFLVSRRRDVTARHRTLRAAIEWSYRLLSPELQRFFSGLSIFQGGWTVEAAHAVFEEPRALDFLEELRASSLIETEPAGEEVRFRMLETLREFGREQLSTAEQAAAAQRHALFFTAWIERLLQDGFSGPEVGERSDRLQREHENFLTALRHLVKADQAESALRLGVRLGELWNIRGYFAEGRRRLAEVLAMRDVSAHPSLVARALNWMGALAQSQSDQRSARDWFEQSLAIYRAIGDGQGIASGLDGVAAATAGMGDLQTARGLWLEALELWRAADDPGGVATALKSLGEVAGDLGDAEAARRYYKESLAISGRLSIRWLTAEILHSWGFLEWLEGDHVRARGMLEESLSHSRSLDLRLEVCVALLHLARVARSESRYPEARAFVLEALAISRELGNAREEANALDTLGMVARDEGDLDGAREFHEQCLAVRWQRGNRRGVILTAERLARLLLQQGDPYRATRLLAAMEMERERIDWPVPRLEQVDHEESLAHMREALGEERFAVARAEGCELPFEQALTEAWGRELPSVTVAEDPYYRSTVP